MWVALALNAVFLVALVAGLAWLFVSVFWGPLAVITFVGLALTGASVGARRWHKYLLPRERAAHVERVVDRLCLVGDLDKPIVVMIEDDVPLSWTTALPGKRPRLHVTTGMVELLGDAELDAVIAHELSHIGDRDAVLMTVLAAPGVYVLSALRAAWRHPIAEHWQVGLLILGVTVVAWPAFVSAGLSRIVSRYRELAADQGAALLTGSPAALASALARLSDGLHAIPEKDLRVAAAGDVLHVVPAKPARGIARLWATHPPLAARIEQLERLEARLQA
jgi:heat shock protein HtpX